MLLPKMLTLVWIINLTPLLLAFFSTESGTVPWIEAESFPTEKLYSVLTKLCAGSWVGSWPA